MSHQGGAINNQVSELHQLWCHAVGVPMRQRPWSRQSRAHTCISLQACVHIWRFWKRWSYSDRSEVKVFIWTVHSDCSCLHSHLFLFQPSLSSLQHSVWNSGLFIRYFMLNNPLQTFNIPLPNMSFLGFLKSAAARWNVNRPNSFRFLSHASICLKNGMETVAMGGWTIKEDEGSESELSSRLLAQM